jgi:predicted TIM-barrel fold metal-dependent hydrolase
MKINAHCHIFSLDCVPEGFRERFSLDFDNPLDRVFFWIVTTLLPNNSKPDEMLELVDLTILEIALRLIREMDEAGIEVCTPLMMDMENCTRFEAGEIKDFNEQLEETEFAAKTINEKYQRRRVLPFIAVDPRRANILEIVKQKIPEKKKDRNCFCGVKIYPPMGYYPYDKALYPIYEYCEANEIPITAHCLNGGIPGLKKEDYKLAHPSSWKRILQDFNNLKLNLGHNDKTGSDWQKIICELVESYPNVYTDVAFNIEMWYKPRQYFKNIKSMLQIENGDDRNMPHRLLYGTDWYMGRFLWTETSYLNWFLEYAKKIIWCGVWFTEDEIKRFTEDNPKAFLGLPA